MAEQGVFVTRSAGVGCPGIEDQYADGKAARLWECLVDADTRFREYRTFLVNLFKEKGCRRILDVACGSGVDSVMLLEEGFEVTSIDASDKMLKHALKKRWNRRNEKAFNNWVIEEANWLTLPDDLEDMLDGGFDAIICLGNSFAHLVDLSGDVSKQKLAISNFEFCIRPGGLLVIDHRNFDAMLSHTNISHKSIYYKSLKGINTSVLYTDGRPIVVTLDYRVNLDSLDIKEKKMISSDEISDAPDFRLSYYPHCLKDFTKLLDNAFPNSQHDVLADFKSPDIIENPGFYIHVVQKST